MPSWMSYKLESKAGGHQQSLQSLLHAKTYINRFSYFNPSLHLEKNMLVDYLVCQAFIYCYLIFALKQMLIFFFTLLLISLLTNNLP